MTQEEKEILLKDLCARLPYGVKYCRDSWNYEWDQEMSVVEVLEDIDKEGYINYHKVYKAWDIKPYLRPMSSMTEEERRFLLKFGTVGMDENDKVFDVYPYGMERTMSVIDFLNANHFDYRRLIEKGLALEAPEGMYKTE